MNPEDEALREFESAANKTCIARQHAMEAAERTCLALRVEIQQLTKERDAERVRTEKAEAALAEAKLPSLEHVQSIYEIAKLKAACAQKDEALRLCMDCTFLIQSTYHKAKHALSSDCGKGWVRDEDCQLALKARIKYLLETSVPKSELDKTIELVLASKSALNEVAAYGSCDCDAPNGELCVFCECTNLIDPLTAEHSRLESLRKEPPVEPISNEQFMEWMKKMDAKKESLRKESK